MSLSADALEALIFEVIEEERDPELTAKDIRHIAEQKLGLPRDALFPRNQEICRVVMKAESPVERLSPGEAAAGRLALAIVAAALIAFSGLPTSLWSWAGLALQTYLGSYVAQAAFGFGYRWFVVNIRHLPLTPGDAGHDECNALLFPLSTEGRRVARRRCCGVDHLVYTCADLSDGADAIERLTGVRPAAGGSHPGVGTHNALLSLGDSAYLEVIAADPAQPTPAAPRPFSLDDERTHGRIIAFAVHPEVARGASIELLAATMQEEGRHPGRIGTMRRRTPSGELLRWRMTALSRAEGPRPWLIDWGGSAHPATTSPAGCSLVGLTCHGARASEMGALLRGRLGLLPLGASGGAVDFVDGGDEAGGYLVAELETPKGRVVVGAASSGLGDVGRRFED